METETRWYFFVPIAPILIIIAAVIIGGSAMIIETGLWIHKHIWYVFGVFAAVFIINFIILIIKSNFTCALSFLLTTSFFFFYLLNRNEFIGTAPDGSFSEWIGYIFNFALFVIITLALCIGLIIFSWFFLGEECRRGYSLSEKFHATLTYFFIELIVAAIGWGFNALVFLLIRTK